MRGIHSEGRLYVGSLGRIEVVGALEKLEVLLGLVCGRRSERNGIQPSHFVFPLGNGRRLHFWKDVGVGMKLYAILSPLFFLLQPIKMS